MFPDIDPKKMQALMKQMGLSQENIDALRVVIEKDDGKIVINNPSVTRMKIQGQESFQIAGDVEEKNPDGSYNLREEIGGEGFSEDDIKTIMEKTGASKEEARNALEETGDLAEAIMKLSE